MTCVVVGQYGAPPGAPGMGRGYPGYAMTPGYPGAAPMVGAGYGYGKSIPFFICFKVQRLLITTLNKRSCGDFVFFFFFAKFISKSFI